MSRLICAAAAATAIAASVGGALADGRIRVTDAIGVYNGSDGSGGAFIITDVGPDRGNFGNGKYGGNLVQNDGRGTGANSFLSFCLERQDHLGFGNQYYTQVSTSAFDGTAPVNQPNPDPINGITSAIYREFRGFANSNTAVVNTTGAFGGLFGSSLSNAETSAIQQAIWFSEEELQWSDISNVTQRTLAQNVYNWGVANSDGALHGVRVLRLWSSYNAQTGVYSGSAQDVLTCIPLPPAAYAGLGTFAGIFTLAAIRRRKLAAV